MTGPSSATRRDAAQRAQARQAATDRYGMVGDSTGRGRAAEAGAAKRKRESAEAARAWPQRAGDARQRLEAAREEVRSLLTSLDGVLRELSVAAADGPPELELAALATERLRESRARAELALLRAQEHADLAVDALHGASLRPSDTREIGKPTPRSD